MDENKPIQFQNRAEKIQSLHAHYTAMRERNAPDISNLFEYDVVDKKIFEKEGELVAEYKKDWEKTNDPELNDLKKEIDIFEGIVADQIDGGNWLGQNVEAIATHEYDDILRGVDTVLEITPEKRDDFKQYLGLGFDLVVHKDERRLEKKLQRFINEDIKKGTLGNLKYYKGSEISGSLDVFRLVIGTDGKTMKELIDLRLKKDYDALAIHPFQADLIYQIILQLQTAIKHADKTDNEKYLSKLAEVARQVNILIENKQEILAQEAERVMNSKDYKTMQTFLNTRLGIDI